MNPKAAMCASHDPSLETARTDSTDDVLISTWEASLKDESEPWSGKMAVGAHCEPTVESKSPPNESHRTSDEDVITKEGKSTKKELVASELSTLIEKSPDNVLRKSLHNVQSSIRSGIYNIIEQVMWDLLRRDIIEDSLSVHVANYSMRMQPPTGFYRGCRPQTHSWCLLRHLWDAKPILPWNRNIVPRSCVTCWIL